MKTIAVYTTDYLLISFEKLIKNKSSKSSLRERDLHDHANRDEKNPFLGT